MSEHPPTIPATLRHDALTCPCCAAAAATANPDAHDRYESRRDKLLADCAGTGKVAIPTGHVAVVDPPSVPLHGPLTCDQHGPTVTVTWRSGEDCPLCEAYANERRLRAALEEWAEGDCAYGDGCPTFGTRHGRCIPCKARTALEDT